MKRAARPLPLIHRAKTALLLSRPRLIHVRILSIGITRPTSVQELLEQIDAINPAMDLAENPFFDVQRLTSPAKMPLEYGPLVHALSALSVGGGIICK